MPDLAKFYKEPLYRNALSILSNVATYSVVGLLFWIIATRTLPASIIGLAAAEIAAGNFILSLARLGYDSGVIRYLPASRNRRRLYNTILLFTLLASVGFAAVFVGGLGIFAPPLTFLWSFVPLTVFFIYIVVSSVQISQNNAILALRRGDLYLVQNVILAVRVPILLILVTYGVTGIMSAFNIATIPSLVFGVYVLLRYGIASKLEIDKQCLKQTFGFSLGNFSFEIFQLIPITVIPIMILDTIGAQANAYFYIAYSIAALLPSIPFAVSTSLFVEGSHDMPLRENVIKSLKFTYLLVILALVVLLAFGDKILLLFGREYSAQSFELLRLLGLSALFSAVTSIYIAIKRVQKKVKAINYVSAAMATLTIGLGYFGLLTAGLTGLGMAWLIANALVSFIVVLQILTKEGWIRTSSSA